MFVKLLQNYIPFTSPHALIHCLYKSHKAFLWSTAYVPLLHTVPPHELTTSPMELSGSLVNSCWLHRHLLMDKYKMNLQAVLLLMTIEKDKHSEITDSHRGDLQALCRPPSYKKACPGSWSVCHLNRSASDHRIIEPLRMEKTTKIILPHHHYAHYTLSLSSTSTLFLKASGDLDSTTSPCSLSNALPLFLRRLFS